MYFQHSKSFERYVMVYSPFKVNLAASRPWRLNLRVCIVVGRFS